MHPRLIRQEDDMESTEAAGMGPRITFADPGVLACPLAAYRSLQAEAPVYLDPVTGMYVITRFADIRAVASDPQTFANNTGQLQGRQTPATARIEALFAAAGIEEVNTMVTNDPPHHRRYRSLVDKAFAPNRVAAMEP